MPLSVIATPFLGYLGPLWHKQDLPATPGRNKFRCLGVCNRFVFFGVSVLDVRCEWAWWVVGLFTISFCFGVGGNRNPL